MAIIIIIICDSLALCEKQMESNGTADATEPETVADDGGNDGDGTAASQPAEDTQAEASAPVDDAATGEASQPRAAAEPSTALAAPYENEVYCINSNSLGLSSLCNVIESRRKKIHGQTVG